MVIRLFCLAVILIASASAGQDFTRDLPGKALSDRVTPEKFPGMDAVIILKEQSYLIRNSSVEYGMYNYTGLSTVFSKNMIVKVLNENGVKRYGTFEFSYNEKFGNKFENGFLVRARVQKADGEVYTIDEDEISTIVTEKNRDGEAMRKKVIFKYPELHPGDIIQYEYQFSDLFSYSTSGLFYLSDRDFVGVSNLAITLPAFVDIKTVSLPFDKIGEPRKEQLSKEYGSGETYFWSVNNLTGIPDEPYSRPFEDVSCMTGFYVEGKYPEARDNWDHIAKTINEDLERGTVGKAGIGRLGFRTQETGITLELIDSLYAGMRKYFALHASNSLYPVIDDLDELFETKKGDASDLAYIMHLILREWGQASSLVMIRDRRGGTYETSIPSLQWFDRLGLLVTIGGKERLYDFDRSLPAHYEFPWYLSPVTVAVLNGDACVHMPIGEETKPEQNRVTEEHHLAMNDHMEIYDAMKIAFSGSQAQKERNELYASEPSEVKKYFKNVAEGSCLLKTDSVSVNNFLDESDVCATVWGQSAVKAEVIDSSVTMSFRTNALHALKNSLFTVSRKTHINFESPMQYRLSWEIAVPVGYRLQSGDETQQVTGPAGCSTQIARRQNESTIRITADVTVPRSIILFDQYPMFMNYLERSIAQIERTIVLAKKAS